eukprot:scaffold18133_cov137-Isochrysis_galbana.AAC.3
MAVFLFLFKFDAAHAAIISATIAASFSLSFSCSYLTLSGFLPLRACNKRFQGWLPLRAMLFRLSAQKRLSAKLQEEEVWGENQASEPLRWWPNATCIVLLAKSSSALECCSK